MMVLRKLSLTLKIGCEYKAMQSPILFLIFNRPNQTKLVFELIKNAKPPRLYIAADGPRSNRLLEADLCRKTREIVKHVDWDCQVKKLFRQKNYGCKESVSQAISWFFKHESEGIILEDDCLPSPSFFPFMDEMLKKYRYVDEIACINGNNIMGDLEGYHDSYFFTVNANVWGWGSWRRVWDLYDLEMRNWPVAKNSRLIEKIFTNKKLCTFWNNVFEKTFGRKIQTWDYQFVFLIFLNNFLCVQPYRNLISNIGFGGDATITKDTSSLRSNQKLGFLNLPIKHPVKIERNFLFENWDANNFKLINRSKRLIKRLIFLIFKL